MLETVTDAVSERKTVLEQEVPATECDRVSAHYFGGRKLPGPSLCVGFEEVAANISHPRPGDRSISMHKSVTPSVLYFGTRKLPGPSLKPRTLKTTWLFAWGHSPIAPYVSPP
jgi:hypothetical protein